jgi:hypothetical protein
MWNDIDYMDQYRDFTNDPVNYPQPEVRQFVQQLHADGQHYIVLHPASLFTCFCFILSLFRYWHIVIFVSSILFYFVSSCLQ